LGESRPDSATSIGSNALRLGALAHRGAMEALIADDRPLAHGGRSQRFRALAGASAGWIRPFVVRIRP
jgi:hypothetical protein